MYMMCPHDLVSTIYAFDVGTFHHTFTGEPGALEAYWAYNTDLATDLGLTHHASCRIIILNSL